MRLVNVNMPLLSVVTVWDAPVAALVIVTVAPSMPPPVSRPEKVPGVPAEADGFV
jgi:hypothetical protein